MPTDPVHSLLGFVPESEKTSLGPASTTAPQLGGAWLYPGYKDDLARVLFLEAAYKGGPSFKKGFDRNGYPIFVQHERESPTRFERRRRLTTYRNYVGPIVDQYTSYIGSTKAVRSKREQFAEWSKNVDRAKTEIHDFFTHSLCKGLLLGKWWVGCDLPKRVEMEVGRTPTAADDAGRVPYVTNVHPSNVVDFSVDDQGNVTRVVVHHEIYEKISFGKPAEFRHEFHEWTSTQLIVWKPVKTADAGTGTVQGVTKQQAADGSTATTPQPGYKIEAGVPTLHGYKQVPFAYLELLEGKGIADDIAEANKTVLNLVGLLYEELYNQTFSQTYITGADEDTQKEVVTGTSTVLMLSNPLAKVHTGGANTEQAASIINALYMEVKEIHRQAHMEQSGEPLQKRVAEAASKLEKSHESMDQILETIANTMQKFERRVMEILAGFGMPQVSVEDAVMVIWPKVFDTKTLRQKIDTAIDLDTVPFIPAAAKRMLASQITEELLEGTVESEEAAAELKATKSGRTPQEVAIAKLLFEAGALGPIELYIQFIDPTASPEKARSALEKTLEDRTKFASVATTGGGNMNPTKKPPNRPEKQPTPGEQAATDAATQAANQA